MDVSGYNGIGEYAGVGDDPNAGDSDNNDEPAAQGTQATTNEVAKEEKPDDVLDRDHYLNNGKYDAMGYPLVESDYKTPVDNNTALKEVISDKKALF